MNDQARVHVTVQGRVQGVGFRYYTYQIAQTLNLVGWVRNRWDESVEICAEGPRDVLETFLIQVHRGSRSAFVTQLDTTWETPTGEFQTFKIAETD